MTRKQIAFYGEYIKDGNGTRAAIAAGFPEKSAHVTAARLLKNPEIAAAIDDWKQRSCAKAELTADMVLAKIAAVLRADPKNLYDSAGNRIPIHLLDDMTRAAIAGVDDEVTETTAGEVRTVSRNQRIKLADGLRAAELGGKYFKLFTDRVEHDGRVTLEQLICGGGKDEARGEPANR